MVDMKKENISFMKLCLVKDIMIDKIMNNMICKEDHIVDFDFICKGRYETYKRIYHDKIKSEVLVYLVENDNVAKGAQCYNVPSFSYDTVRYCIFISKQYFENNDFMFKFILGHELAHFDLCDLPKSDDVFRCPLQEMYCDVKSLEYNGYKTLSNEQIDTIAKSFGVNNEAMMRLDCLNNIDKYNSDCIYEKIMNKVSNY